MFFPWEQGRGQVMGKTDSSIVSGQALGTPSQSRQHRKESKRELPEVGDVDVPVVVEIECGNEAGLAGAQVERRGKQPEVGDIHMPVAIDVAVEAEQALLVAKSVVVAAGAVGVAVKLQATRSDLIGNSRQCVSPVAQRARISFRAGEGVKRNDRGAVNDASGRREVHGAAPGPLQRERARHGARERHLSVECDRQACHA